MGEMYDRVCSWDNLWLAYDKAARGKRGRRAAATFEYNLADRLIELRQELLDKSYQPGAYSSFYIHEPKRRLISAAPFRDRVVHHALCTIIEPIFERGFIADSYANRKAKGTHRALDRAQAFARRYRYVLQCDVRQFFPSIDHALLEATLARKLDDPDVLWLVERILESGAGVLSDEYEMVWFPGDDLLAATRPRGLPIGNLTSQFWANCYLDRLDHFCKRELRCQGRSPGYVRYVDDFLLYADDKRALWDCRAAIVERLAGLRLVIHPGAHPRPVTEGIPFLGFVVYPTHRRVKSRKVVAYRRRIRRLVTRCMASTSPAGGAARKAVVASLLAWINHVRYGDTWGLRRSVVRSIPPL